MDDVMIGKVGRMTGTAEPGSVGEVMIPVRGGTEAFFCYASDPKEEILKGTRVIVIEYEPPRTVIVAPY